MQKLSNLDLVLSVPVISDKPTGRFDIGPHLCAGMGVRSDHFKVNRPNSSTIVFIATYF